jgi:nitric oxide reductase large subunit
LWPARSLHLKSLDFFVWGHLKELIYREQPPNMEDMVAKLHAAMMTTDADILQQVQASIL